MPHRPAPSIVDVERQYQIGSPDEREQRFRRVFDDGPMGIVLVGTDFRFLAVNRAFCEMLGYDDTELLERGFPEVTHPDDVDENREAARQLFSGEATAMRLEKRYLTRTGDTVYVRLSGWPIRNSAGAVTHVLNVVQDITAQKEARASAARLRGALEERDTLLREVHHRVKNNLQVVSSLLTLQLGHLQDPATRMMVQESQSRISAMALVHEKLYQADDLAHVDLQVYLKSVTRAVGHAYSGSAHQVDVRVDVESIPLDLDSAVRCGLIVNELASNAYKHAFPGRSTGRIEIGLTTPTPGVAELVVADDGLGIAQDIELDRMETLGLQLVHHLAKQLGGDIRMSGEHGTRFAVSFPIEEPRRGQ